VRRWIKDIQFDTFDTKNLFLYIFTLKIPYPLIFDFYRRKNDENGKSRVKCVKWARTMNDATKKQCHEEWKTIPYVEVRTMSRFMNGNPYENLVNAIIVQAADDYRAAIRSLKKCPYDYNSKDILREIERFFRSAWYAKLTTVDGELILEGLREEEGYDEERCG